MLIVTNVEPSRRSGSLEAAPAPASFGEALGADAAALFGFEAAFGFPPFGLERDCGL
jgi:hypothetical protein